MPKECVARKMKTGRSKDAAVKACYPDSRFAKDRKQYKSGKGGGIQNLKPQTRQQIGKAVSIMKKVKKKKGY